MKVPKDQKPLPAALRSLYRGYQMLTQAGGNTLLYILVLLVIFSVLGITMVSLFTTSTTSSATPNDARRAYYMAESAVRYAASRIKNTRFRQSFIEEINQTPQYTLDNGSSFKIEIFSPWFISPTNQDLATGDNPFTLSVPNDGKIPQNFSIPSGPEFRLVNLKTFKFDESLGIYPPQTYAEITDSSISVGSNSLTITLEGSHGLQIRYDPTGAEGIYASPRSQNGS